MSFFWSGKIVHVRILNRAFFGGIGPRSLARAAETSDAFLRRGRGNALRHPDERAGVVLLQRELGDPVAPRDDLIGPARVHHQAAHVPVII